MEIEDNILFDSEKIIFSLRRLYNSYGYELFKIKKFEEFSLYAKLEDILQIKNIISFVDTNGQTLALKPDITLSIVKSFDEDKNQKVCYNEQVYRILKGTERFGESSQIGIENMGDIKISDVAEVIVLAYKSLQMISAESVLILTNMDILKWAIEHFINDDIDKDQILKFIVDKNISDLEKFCKSNKFSDVDINKLLELCSGQKSFDETVELLNKINCPDELIKNIKDLEISLKETNILDKVRFDFSIADNISYYNGFAFKGFVKGIPSAVVCGGQYDNLMKALDKKSKGVGAAVYLDFIEYYER